MKIAVLLLVHKNKEQIKRLLNRIQEKETDIFIHISKNSDLEASDFLDYSNQVFVLPVQHDIKLFSFDMVKATLDLIRLAQTNGNYKYFILMGGQDYLIKPFKFIKGVLSSAYPHSYMDVTPAHKDNWVYNSFKKANCFKRFRGKNNIKAASFHNSVLKTVYKAFTVLPFKLISYLRVSPQTVLKNNNIDMYGGAQWWILSDICINAVLQWHQSNSHNIIKSLEYVGSPDETFFQTCLMNTQCKELVDVNHWKEVLQNNKTFTHFSDQGHPIILTSDHFQEIQESNKWFARKFDITVDSDILDRIDDELLK